MSASIYVTGLLKTYTNGTNFVEVNSGLKILEILKIIGIPSELVALVTVNDVASTKDYALADGDIVRLYAVVGGG
jgi:sulfur carrier protein ThiS